MGKLVAFIFTLSLLFACSTEADSSKRNDVTNDTTRSIIPPTFDISGAFVIKWNDQLMTPVNSDEGPFVSILSAKETDTLYIQYAAETPCEECRLETQIWLDAKYKDVVRDTGYGTGDWTAIPVSQLNYYPEQPNGQTMALYLSVRQYHPVETGNKRFLFNLKLAFSESD